MTLILHHYEQIKLLHIACVVLSGGLFTVRGLLMLRGSALANHATLKRASYFIDTVLLLAALALAVSSHQYPFAQAWLTAKVLLLPVYIVFGIFALRRGKTLAARAGFFVAALAVYALIIGIALMHAFPGA